MLIGYCTNCGYNLEAHRTGDTCPECGKVADTVDRVPPPHPLIGRIALGAAAAPVLIWVAIGNFPALCASAAIIPVLLAAAIRERRRMRLTNHTMSIVLSAIAATAPMMTFALYIPAFITGPSGSVAPPASSAFDFWVVWCVAWPLLLLGGLLCFLTGLFALLMPPYDRRLVSAWALPVSSLTAVIIAMRLAFTHFPTV